MREMENCLSRSLARITMILLIFLMTAATRTYSAPSEESISGSNSQMRRLPSTAVKGRGASSEDPETEPAVQESDQRRPEDENARTPGVTPSEPSLPTPRAVFPYTVRTGDTPGGIAGLFGVSLADLLRVNHLHQDSDLQIGDTLRIPNPFLAREREL